MQSGVHATGVKDINVLKTIPISISRLFPLLLIAAALGGCGSLPGLGTAREPVPPAQATLPPPRPEDPLAAFAATAREGQQAMLPPAPGAPPALVRVARSYFAGSGRNCRELAMGGGRAALYCEDASSGWAAARPLLRGGAVARP